MERIILASASPRRKELLEKAGVRFLVISSKGEEVIAGTGPEEIVKKLSCTKAWDTAKAVEKEAADNTVVIGADTVVSYEGKILGKPLDEEDAVHTLLKLQGQTHQVYTGVTLLVRSGDGWRSHSFAECTDVEFYPVPEQEIRQYVRTGDSIDKAGSYGIQGPFGIHVKGIRGDYNNVVGLPVARLFHEAKEQKIHLKG